MQYIFQYTSGDKDNNQVQITSVEDRGVNYHKEKNQRPKKKISNNYNNNKLWDSRKNQYPDERTKYQAALKREKIKSWKEFCNLTSATNPWNAFYKIAKNKAKRNQIL